jgi:hypothetical protein
MTVSHNRIEVMSPKSIFCVVCVTTLCMCLILLPIFILPYKNFIAKNEYIIFFCYQDKSNHRQELYCQISRYTRGPRWLIYSGGGLLLYATSRGLVGLAKHILTWCVATVEVLHYLRSGEAPNHSLESSDPFIVGLRVNLLGRDP